MSKVQTIHQVERSRVETGALQFGDDWPGLFVRGDDCVLLAQTIRRILGCLTPAQAREVAAQGATLTGLADTIERDVLLPASAR